MHNRLGFIAVLSLALILPAILSLRGRADQPNDTESSADTKVDVEAYLYSQLKQHNAITGMNLPFAIYVQKVEGRRLVKPVLKRRDAQGNISWIAHADSGELKVPASKKKLIIYLHQCTVSGEDGSRGSFEKTNFTIDLPEGFGEK